MTNQMPDNAIMGDATGVDLPEMEIPKEHLVEEKKMVKYSRSAEFKRIKEWCKGRIEFYQTNLPNGLEVGLEVVPTAEDWRVANRVIGELRVLMNMYEVANDAVDKTDG